MAKLFEYGSLNDAAQGLLVETCSALGGKGISYVIAGGWVPYLTANVDGLQHPGTHDVDILFDDNPDPMKSAVKIFLERGFVPSAKHEFQLLRPLMVNGKELMFNVDLMHPVEAAKHGDMFHDIIDIGVKDNYDPAGSRKIKSICFPSSQIVFDRKLWSARFVEGVTSEGNRVNVEVPLMSGAATVMSKCKSARNEKRTRDAFDLYLLLSGNEGQQAATELKTLAASFPQVKEQVQELETFLRDEPGRFDLNVSRYAKTHTFTESPSAFVIRQLFS
ncbi:MAG: hypothetical protein JSR99_17930 [Proteobacteria bacterium]|nr:hypothetical protein [Pseudomonadota bacterium]